MQNKVKLYWFAFMFVLFEFSTYAANDMIMPGMLQVVSDFHASLDNVAESLTMFMLGACSLQLALGPLAEKYGKRKIIIVGAICFLIFTLFLTLAQNMHQFMWSRLLQGSCMAFVAIGYGVIHRRFNDKEALKITALMANVSILAPLIGPVIGGVVVTHLSWRFIFVFSAITGCISLIGLIKFTPFDTVDSKPIKALDVIIGYWQILIHPQFIVGVLAIVAAMVPFLLWIGFSPTIIMHTAKLNMNHYIAYQVIAVGGFMLSTLLIQHMAGRISLNRFMYIGISLITCGIFIALFGHSIVLAIAIGLGVYNSGLAFINGSVMRIIGTLNVKAKGFIFPLVIFFDMLLMALIIEAFNLIFSHYNYSQLSYALANFIFGIVVVSLILCFIRMNRTRVIS